MWISIIRAGWLIQVHLCGAQRIVWPKSSGSLANSSMHILDKFLNVLPTVTIREGNRVKVYLSGDLLLPDYSQHAMQPDI